MCLSPSTVAGCCGSPWGKGTGGCLPASVQGRGGGVRPPGGPQVPHAADCCGAAQCQRARRKRARILLAAVCQGHLPLPQDPSDQPPATCGLQWRARAGQSTPGSYTLNYTCITYCFTMIMLSIISQVKCHLRLR